MEDNLFSSLPGLPPAKGSGDPVLPVPYDPAPAPAPARPRAGSGAAPRSVSSVSVTQGWIPPAPAVARRSPPGARSSGVPGGPDCPAPSRPPPPRPAGRGLLRLVGRAVAACVEQTWKNPTEAEREPDDGGSRFPECLGAECSG